MRTRLRRGDPDVLGELYDEHAQVLYRYALRVTGDWAEAEDVVSTTFLEAWRGREKLHPDGDRLRPWLLGIATNIMRRTARARRRRDIALARLPERGLVPDFADDLVAHLADVEHLRAAHRALARLRHRDREVFTLVVWAGLDYASAAEALGTPVGTVRSRLSRARARLRELTEAEARAQAKVEARARAEARVPSARHRHTGTGKPPAAEGRTPSAVTALPVPGRIPALRPSIHSIQESHG
ncbi:RNA polymerase sigma factor [Kitasatospora sp. CB01950]|uniref:RNA polymerase sigma factor n=1 Tax=Kitasatospora sp. CB01950 TaxID=1703930 RepID=UPI000A9C793B|nr:sigma-70 family RNA polymerase sigma factor [Kitasatospora sp. CB01950]